MQHGFERFHRGLLTGCRVCGSFSGAPQGGCAYTVTFRGFSFIGSQGCVSSSGVVLFMGSTEQSMANPGTFFCVPKGARMQAGRRPHWQ